MWRSNSFYSKGDFFCQKNTTLIIVEFLPHATMSIFWLQHVMNLILADTITANIINLAKMFYIIFCRDVYVNVKTT